MPLFVYSAVTMQFTITIFISLKPILNYKCRKCLWLNQCPSQKQYCRSLISIMTKPGSLIEWLLWDMQGWKSLSSFLESWDQRRPSVVLKHSTNWKWCRIKLFHTCITNRSMWTRIYLKEFSLQILIARQDHNNTGGSLSLSHLKP